MKILKHAKNTSWRYRGTNKAFQYLKKIKNSI